MRRTLTWLDLSLVAVAAAVAAVSLCAMVGFEPAGPVGGNADAGPVQRTTHRARFRYAEGVSIEYHDGWKLLTVKRPWRGATESYRYLLVDRDVELPQGRPEATVVRVPVRRMVSLSTTILPHLDRLQWVDRLVGIGDDKLISTQSVVDRVASGRIVVVGEYTALDPEKVYATEADVVMMSPTESGDRTRIQLEQTGIPVMLYADWMETNPLGRAEWVKVLAAFFNDEHRAHEWFSQMADRYTRLKRLAATVSDRPTVVTEAEFRGTWWMPGGASYMARFVQDAGADYLFKNNTERGSRPLDVETVLARAQSADYWLSPGQFTSLEAMKKDNPLYGSFKAFRTGQVYNNDARTNRRGGNDYWETGIVNPDEILADLIGIFHPDLLPGHRLKWFRKLPAQAEGARP